MLQNIFVHFNKSNKFEATNFVYIAGIGEISFFYLNVRLCACFQALCAFSSSVRVFIKLCACFQALCMFSSSVHVFKLCACFQALCMFSGSVCVFKLCACFQALCVFSSSVCVFKLCVCFQALCVFLSSSVRVFKLCACFYQALCVFSSSVRVIKLCACFHYLKSILFLFCIISYICKTGNSGIWIFPCFLDSDFCFSVMYFFLLMLTFLPIEGIYPLFNVWVFLIFLHTCFELL